ncbi:SCO family protein [Pseudomonas chlororaphis]|jgi:protein SCO1/2|uniref:SCO family protein n=1 Tax=Pseudomonas morbosilactucae TaxID=2938197 RepID=A0A9X1YYT1_9PSED|nr:SCO family protein [Pseudomonas morbosilactucae]MCK9800728.1 SCO family protein [Pseudomonas morbosilactucae]MCK9815470.1 SCO family protein [Pseudomonas morbosilactucae]ROL65863.1 SCO family protein [Pseudomonas chlororaphis]
MSVLFTRRQVIGGMSLLSLGLLAGCDSSNKLNFKYGKDLSDKIMGRTFKLTNSQGEPRLLSSYRGLMPMVFFGFTQCPAVCPTALARAVQIKKLMGRDGDRLQVVFITLDPERDTPEVLDAYVKAFDPSFEALYGTLEQTAATAKEFGVFYEKIPSGSTYTLSHTATSYVFDSRGELRLGLSASLNAQECAEDLLTVMEVC